MSWATGERGRGTDLHVQLSREPPHAPERPSALSQIGVPTRIVLEPIDKTALVFFFPTGVVCGDHS